MGDIEEKLRELDPWYKGTDDPIVEDATTPDHLISSFSYHLERFYGHAPADHVCRFRRSVAKYSALDLVTQRRCYGVLAFALVQDDAANDDEHEQCLKSILDVAELAGDAFNGLDEHRERWLIQRIRHYLACDRSDPPEPDSQANLRAVISLLSGERNL
ncbi:hypothetical protein HY642_02295 [Candidatus Woesearchaeota archaeon]|nr:hypothetical protein [Candidatus Woesearchaeota archaeon]